MPNTSKRVALVAALLTLTPIVGAEDEIEAVVAHPLFDSFFQCSEHFADQFKYLGDALGSDCVVTKLVTVDGRMWSRTHEGDGSRNEDWYGYHTEVMSPCTCTVVDIRMNDVENEPGRMGKPPASFITLKRQDDVHFSVAHVRDIRVEEGDTVEAGQVIGMVGNNGMSRSPHIHLGAWKGETPLQIRFDQRRMKLPPEFRKD